MQFYSCIITNYGKLLTYCCLPLFDNFFWLTTAASLFISRFIPMLESSVLFLTTFLQPKVFKRNLYQIMIHLKVDSFHERMPQ